MGNMMTFRVCKRLPWTRAFQRTSNHEITKCRSGRRRKSAKNKQTLFSESTDIIEISEFLSVFGALFDFKLVQRSQKCFQNVGKKFWRQLRLVSIQRTSNQVHTTRRSANINFYKYYLDFSFVIPWPQNKHIHIIYLL